MPAPATTLLGLLRDGPAPAAKLLGELGISRPTLSRLVNATPGVVRLGRARATRYALKREIRTFGSSWPVYRVGPDGRAVLAATLHALVQREWWYEHLGARPDWLVGEFANGLFPDFPWFLDDLRPQGFVGRAFARLHAQELGLSPDPRLWDASGVLVSLLGFGEDLPGDLVIGDPALERFQRGTLNPPPPIPAVERSIRYAALAATALQGGLPGSSAAGEQPKFTACCEDGGSPRQVLVKFSPLMETPGGERWADLLVFEHLASEVLREHGVSASQTQLLDGGGRRFLEVTRFDRVGAHGRRGFVTLLPLGMAYYGGFDSWATAADRLEHDGWLTGEEAQRLRLLWWFGGLIANTDMHLGNVSVSLDTLPCSLAPAYDMLPMLYRPEASGELVPRTFLPPLPKPAQALLWRQAAALALRFWQRAGEDGRVSAAMRAQAMENGDAIRALLERFG
jgi:hypothetical protein